MPSQMVRIEGEFDTFKRDTGFWEVGSFSGNSRCCSDKKWCRELSTFTPLKLWNLRVERILLRTSSLNSHLMPELSIFKRTRMLLRTKGLKNKDKMPYLKIRSHNIKNEIEKSVLLKDLPEELFLIDFM